MYQILRTTAGRFLKSPRDQVLLAGTLAYLLALEAIGRELPGGVLVDLFLFTALLVGGAWLSLAHMRKSISWISLGTHRVRRIVRSLRRHTYRIGWDLRREPAIPRRVPPVVLALVAGCELSTLAALIWIVWQPIPARTLIGGISSVGFAAAQFVLWSALLFVIVAVLLAGPALLRDLYDFRRIAMRDGGRPVHSRFFFGLFVTLCMVGICLPPFVATLILAGSLLAGCVGIWLLPGRDFDFIWQPRDRAVVYSMPWRTCVSLMNPVLILVCLLLLFLAVGPEAVGLPAREPEGVSVSRTLGIITGWVVATGTIVFLWPVAMLKLSAIWLDPGRPAPARVRVTGSLTRAERRRIRNALRPRGWCVRFGGSKTSATDVPVQIRSATDAPAAESAWPRTVSLDELDDEQLQWSIARRDQIQRRRMFLRTLESMLKQARRRRYAQSSGFWVAPQYWFILGLTRDTGDRGQDEEEATILDVIPPLYHRAFPRPVRQHFHEVCRATGIDLIYLEDGVPWRSFRRVLRMLFEHYDMHAGAGLIEEMHFTGVPRVRVIIHEFELGAEWERDRYPEPDFEDLARARVLHVFRDRGAEEVPRETPMDWDRLPSPVPVWSTPS